MKPIISICAIAAMTCSVATWADRSTQSPISEQVTGQWVTDCGDFLVLEDYRIEGFQRSYFREDGSLSRVFGHVSYPDSVFYNAADPSYWVPGKPTTNSNWVYFDESGNPISQARMGASLRIILPGYGPVYVDVGRWVFDTTLGEFVFMAGQHDHFEGLLQGQQETDALCAALRP